MPPPPFWATDRETADHAPAAGGSPFECLTDGDQHHADRIESINAFVAGEKVLGLMDPAEAARNPFEGVEHLHQVKPQGLGIRHTGLHHERLSTVSARLQALRHP